MSRTTAQPQALTAGRIRRRFIEFFVEKHGHTFVPSSPVVPHDDPTLLFTNAGMNQFKDVFLGQGSRDYLRAVNSQKCIRAGGKHNDLEDVGKDHYHHTFFEMLGNWSFGDYFKAEAIEWAWELLTAPPPDGWGLDPNRLFVTVFGGDEAEGLAPDEEAEALWKRHVDPSRIGRFGRKDNFWEMGETGPCGPCSEIHYDFSPQAGGGARLVNTGDPAVIELWNLVFIQFNRGAGGKLTELPARHVDTGMGLERLTRVLQHKDSNYDTDLFTPIFAAIETHTGVHPYRGTLEDPLDVAYRVIADHVRCLTTAICDGAWPSNEGRGFVLRRILRRAVRHAHQTLQTTGPWLHELVNPVVGTLGDAFPELTERPDRVASVIHDEEEGFLRTLDRGLALFEQAADAATGGRLAAGDAFRLHDTFGFPFDLTRVMAEERGLTVDEAGYRKLMDEARQRSREAGRGAETPLTLPPEAIARLRHLEIEPTDDSPKYEAKPINADVRAVWNGTDFDEDAQVGRRVALILDRTNLYAEAGGQVGDRGRIFEDSEAYGTGYPDAEFLVEDTQAVGGYVLHIGRVTDRELRVGTQVTVMVERGRREPTRANHTATHLLNQALREAIGPEQDQKGSLVAPDRLRFDYSCSHAPGHEQIEQIEARVNESIDRAMPVHAAVMPLETARSIEGVRAVFGEKYPDPVRVVSIGADLDEVRADPGNERWRPFSIELCGGTHLADTGQAGRFVIVHEQALAAGVRRVTAVTGAAAQAAVQAGAKLRERAEAAAGLEGASLVDEYTALSELLDQLTIGAAARQRVDALLESLRRRVKTLRKERKSRRRAGAVEVARQVAAESSGPVIVAEVPATDRDNLLAAMDAVRARHGDAAVMLIGADDEKVTIVARVPDSLNARGLKAGDWVREPARICGGSGGGRPDMAQAGGKDPKKVPEAISAAREYAERSIA